MPSPSVPSGPSGQQNHEPQLQGNLDSPELAQNVPNSSKRVCTRTSNLNIYIYCVNTSYPMDNCFTGRHDRSCQTPEKDILFIIPAGPVK